MKPFKINSTGSSDLKYADVSTSPEKKNICHMRKGKKNKRFVYGYCSLNILKKVLGRINHNIILQNYKK